MDLGSDLLFCLRCTWAKMFTDLICNVQIKIVHRGDNIEDENIYPYINTVDTTGKEIQEKNNLININKYNE